MGIQHLNPGLAEGFGIDFDLVSIVVEEIVHNGFVGVRLPVGIGVGFFLFHPPDLGPVFVQKFSRGVLTAFRRVQSPRGHEVVVPDVLFGVYSRFPPFLVNPGLNGQNTVCIRLESFIADCGLDNQGQPPAVTVDTVETSATFCTFSGRERVAGTKRPTTAHPRESTTSTIRQIFHSIYSSLY